MSRSASEGDLGLRSSSFRLRNHRSTLSRPENHKISIKEGALTHAPLPKWHVGDVNPGKDGFFPITMLINMVIEHRLLNF